MPVSASAPVLAFAFPSLAPADGEAAAHPIGGARASSPWRPSTRRANGRRRPISDRVEALGIGSLGGS